MQAFRRLTWLAGVTVEINDMMTRLVAMPVFADAAALIVRRQFFGGFAGGEKRVQFLDKLFLSAHQRNQARHVLRHIPGVLRTGPFGEITVGIVAESVRIEGRAPVAL